MNNNFDLLDTALWLVKMRRLPSKNFTEFVSRFDLSQEGWDTFWKALRASENDVVGGMVIWVHSESTEALESKLEPSEIEVMIGDREYMFTEQEFEVVKQVLNNLDPEEISNCCGAGVYPHRHDDHSSICRDCKEGCGIVYLF